jgi:hypothetical protein
MRLEGSRENYIIIKDKNEDIDLKESRDSAIISADRHLECKDQRKKERKKGTNKQNCLLQAANSGVPK